MGIEELIENWHQLGIGSGAKLLVHSSLRSLGRVAGGADTVIESLLRAIGPAGTLVAPTLTGNKTLSAANPPYFDPDHTPCWTGMIPETLRKRPDAVRSQHPTHSAAAIGADARAVTGSHRRSVTPCDELSPYGRLTEFTDSFVLLIGVTHENSTLFHYIEEIAGVDYHMQPGFAAAQVVVDGHVQTRHVMLHRYGTPRNFDVMEPLFIEQGIQRTTQVGNAAVRLVHVGAMVRTTLRALAADKTILCDLTAQLSQEQPQ
jgi:aminoglycoside 3-N-acetyltransferase